MNTEADTHQISGMLMRLEESQPPAKGVQIKCLIRDTIHMLSWPVPSPGYRKVRTCPTCVAQIKNKGRAW